MAQENDGWQILKALGQGGQGIVYLARSPVTRRRRNELLSEMQQTLQAFKPHHPEPDKLVMRLADAITEWRDVDSPAGLGALKKLRIDGPHVEKAHERFLKEVAAFERFKDKPGLLKLLHANQEQRFIVTEFHPAGTLKDCKAPFTGKALEALNALRPVVAALADLHAEGVVHRDIKPDNIFLARTGQLVLGDFGIIHFDDPGMTRLSETYDNVGSRDWMPAWAHGIRIDDVTPAFDVFSLGKTLWAMVSGKTKLPLWYHRRDAFDVEKLFPADPAMPTINAILDKCIVEEEKDCLKDAGALLKFFDQSIDLLQGGGQRLRPFDPRPCRVCGLGRYQPGPKLDKHNGQRLLVAPPIELKSKIDATQLLISPPGTAGFTIYPYICDRCGHFQFFWQPDGGWLPAWTS